MALVANACRYLYTLCTSRSMAVHVSDTPHDSGRPAVVVLMAFSLKCVLHAVYRQQPDQQSALVVGLLP